MTCAFVVHAAEDAPFVSSHLLPVLPLLGIAHWQPIAAGGALTVDPSALASVGLVVVSRSLAATRATRSLIAGLRSSGRKVVPLRIDGTEAAELPGLGELTSAAPMATGWTSLTLFQALGDLLPAPDFLDDEGRARGEPLGWHHDLFSASLKQALDRRAFDEAERLVSRLTRRLAADREPYPTDAAHVDLDELRRKRQFLLMRAYCEHVLAQGTAAGFPPTSATSRAHGTLRMRRQLGQALIELGHFGPAVEVLREVVRDSVDGPHAGDALDEGNEARGLLGRAFKQQYVNAPHAPEAARLLHDAIEAYHTAFARDPHNSWCGVNEASLRLRGCRDGRLGEDHRKEAMTIARRLASTLREKDTSSLWDCATSAEVLWALGDVAGAKRELERYLAHPALDAFEVSSTHRQFEEVLELHRHPEGAALLDRLFAVVKRHRAPGIELSHQGQAIKASSEARSQGVLLRVADPSWQPSTRATVVLHARLGPIVAASCSPDAIDDLLKDPGVVSLEASHPTDEALPLECATSVPFLGVASRYLDVQGAAYVEKGERALIAIIDNGIDVLHEAFLDEEGRSRIVAIWDQSPPADTLPSPPAGFGYGVEHTAGDIAGYLAAQRVPASLGRNLHGHGTHVASIAAGRKTGDFAGGVAPGASIVVVIPSSKELIGYSTAHLDALAYIDRIAEERKLPVVVNLSQGMNSGAHDGRSQLEVAFDAFSRGGRKPGRIIVKSAGNERATNAHAKLAVATGTVETLEWQRGASPRPGQPSRDHLELWWDSANEFRVSLQDPEGTIVRTTDDPLSSEVRPLANGTSIAFHLVKRHIDNGDTLLSIDISGPDIPRGAWRLEIESVQTPGNADVHAWIERSTEQPPTVFTTHVSPEVTLTVPGTAQNVITVAAVGASFPLRLGEFSSFGPTRDGRPKPDVAAPGIDVVAADGGTARGTRSDRGTSMAAPHVTGAVALVLSKCAKTNPQLVPTATQVTAALRQKLLKGTGHYAPGLGYGVPDIAALLAAFP